MKTNRSRCAIAMLGATILFAADGVLADGPVRVLQDRHGRDMALPAAFDGREAAPHDLAQDVVERADEVRRLGVMAALVLRDDLSVASGASIGGDDGQASSRDWTWVFAVLGFASLILCMRKGRPLWDVRRSVLGSLPVRQSKNKKTLRRETRTDLATP